MSNQVQLEPTVAVENRNLKIKNNITDFLQSVVIAIAICIVTYFLIATPNQIEGESMEPNFYNGEIVLTSKIHQWFGSTQIGKSMGFTYNRGDVAVFQKPGFKDFIKRIIAVPGDKIQLIEGNIYVNDEELDESYLPAGITTHEGTFLKDGGSALTVPQDQYFLMGDNRSNSHDSRYSDIAFIKREWFKGKVLVRYWPINTFKIINQ